MPNYAIGGLTPQEMVFRRNSHQEQAQKAQQELMRLNAAMEEVSRVMERHKGAMAAIDELMQLINQPGPTAPEFDPNAESDQ